MTANALLDSKPVSLPAAADLSAKLFRFGKLTSSGINVCSVAGERADGIIGAHQVKNPVAGDAVDFYIERLPLLEAGDVVAAGAELTPDANGKGVTATAGQYVGAVAVDAATAAGQYIRVRPPYAKAPSAGTVSDSQTGPGAIVGFVINIADAATADYDRVMAEKFELLYAIIQKRGGAGTGTCTVQLKNSANAVTDVIDVADADKVISLVGTIDDAYSTFAPADILRASVVDGGNSAIQITVIGVKRA